MQVPSTEDIDIKLEMYIDAFIRSGMNTYLKVHSIG
jgi:hypothetical protein